MRIILPDLLKNVSVSTHFDGVELKLCSHILGILIIK